MFVKCGKVIYLYINKKNNTYPQTIIIRIN